MKYAFRAILLATFVCGIWFSVTPTLATQSTTTQFLEAEALSTSQDAIGRAIGDFTFRNSSGGTVQLSDYLGKPLALNFIYTACIQSCNVNTAWLVDVYETANEAFGDESFTALTVGFDTAYDTPGRMQQFASQRDADEVPGWHFLSGNAESVAQIARTAGFTYFESAKGFDHLDQVTLIDSKGIIRVQVYGELFEKPTLIDPLKNLLFGTATPYRSLEDLIKKVRLFCTLYDPATERYRFNYSLFIQLGVGALFICSILIFLARDQITYRRRRRKATNQEPPKH